MIEGHPDRVTVAYAADYLSVSTSHTRNLVRQGKLRRQWIDGRTYMVLMDCVLEYSKSRRLPGRPGK